MKNKTILLPLLFVAVLMNSCSYNDVIEKSKTISRHYTLKNGHASLDADDYGEEEYITSVTGGITTTKYCNFDSFSYYETETSSTPIHHKGFSDYVSASEELTYFNFHYDGRCEYKITLIDNITCFENSGRYQFVSEDEISIVFQDGVENYAITRFGLNHKGIGEGRITYLQSPLEVPINDEITTIYFWFYDSILHPSPWGEK